MINVGYPQLTTILIIVHFADYIEEQPLNWSMQFHRYRRIENCTKHTNTQLDHLDQQLDHLQTDASPIGLIGFLRGSIFRSAPLRRGFVGVFSARKRRGGGAR